MVFLVVLSATIAALQAADSPLPKVVSLPIAAGLTVVVDQILKPWLARRERRQRREVEAADALSDHLGARARLRLVSDCDPYSLGVHRTSLSPGHDLPTYVERDVHRDLCRRLERARVHGGFLLLVGGASAGKTRCLFEAVRQTLASWSLLQPDDGDLVVTIADSGLRTLQTVIWLDELQQFLDGPELPAKTKALTDAAVKRFLQADDPAVIVATIWPARHDELMASERESLTGSIRYRFPNARAVLQLDAVQRIPIGAFSRRERERADAVARSDPLIAEALASGDYEITEVLAAAPSLVARWETAPPPARALITAAIDCHRLGHRAPLTAELLRDAAAGYLTPIEQARLPANWFADALEYAVSPLANTSVAVLASSAKSASETPGAYTIADYLIQRDQRTRRAVPVPPPTWRALLEHANLPADQARVGDSAAARGLLHEASLLYRRAGVAGHAGGQLGLARVLDEVGHVAEAEQVLRDALRSGMKPAWPRLSSFLMDHHRGDEAIELVQEAVARRIPDAWWGLAVMLHGRGRDEEALVVAREAVEAGERGARLRLAELLKWQQRWPEAREIALDELVRDERNAAPDQDLLTLLRSLDWYLLEVALSPRAARGDLAARHELVDLLRQSGREEEAIGLVAGRSVERRRRGWSWRRPLFPGRAVPVLRKALTAGQPYVREWLADVLKERGQIDEAVRTLREGLLTASVDTWEHLAYLLEDAGLSGEAEQVLRDATAAGVDDAWPRLYMYVHDRRPADAEEVMRQAVTAGQPSAWFLWRHSHRDELRYGLSVDGSPAPPW